jgi:hypothetical protein
MDALCCKGSKRTWWWEMCKYSTGTVDITDAYYTTPFWSLLLYCVLFILGLSIDCVCSLLCWCAKVNLTGFEGPNCTQDIDECSRDVLLCGEGSCVNIAGSYRCICPRGKCGLRCAEDDPCIVSMCSQAHI